MPDFYIGLMSGTSMDGIDAVLCEFDQHQFIRAGQRHCLNYPAALRSRLLHLQREEPALPLSEFCELDNAVAHAFADTALALMQSAGLQPSHITALGSHGQTVFHDPAGIQCSLQLGNPSAIAARTGVTTVADFRRADLARGGQGAPLVPAFHHALFADAAETRCVINIGGIANITLLNRADPHKVLGFDTGPGNGLMDEWTERHQQKAFDSNGDWARSGRVNEQLLNALLADDYFGQPPPKSTGRGYFNVAWVQRLFPTLGELPSADVQRSLCELTASSLRDAIRRHAPNHRRILICGGGARNGFLLDRLRSLMPETAVQLSDDHGLGAMDVEAAAFAWLAMRTMNGLPGNLPAATGARQAAILGGIYRA